MFSNKTHKQIKDKFSFNPLGIKHIESNINLKLNIKSNHDDEQVSEEEDVEKYLAIASVPNYLEQPPTDFNLNKPLYFCLFQIITEGLDPFLMFLLHKHDANDANDIGFIPFISPVRENLKKTGKNYLSTLFIKEEGISYAGFASTTDYNVLIYKYIPINSSVLNANYYWTTTSEIINTRSFLDMPIKPIVVDFFYKNPAFLFLKNAAGVIYASPLIGYYKAADIKRSELMDINREWVSPTVGKCYAFYITLPPKAANETLMRAALFLPCAVIKNGKYILTKYNQHLPLSYVPLSYVPLSYQ